MKNNKLPLAFTMPDVIQFLNRSDYDVEEQIKNLKIEHNRLKDKYFKIIKESSVQQLQLKYLSEEYNNLLFRISNLTLLQRGTPYIPIIIEVSSVIEDTMFAIWKYMYDNKMSA